MTATKLRKASAKLKTQTKPTAAEKSGKSVKLKGPVQPLSPEDSAPARSTRQKQGDSTRQKILRAATLEFAEHGFKGSSTHQIGQRAGVPQGLLRYHFGPKESLWKEVVNQVFLDLAKGMLPAQIELDPTRRLALALRQYVQFTARHPEHSRLMQQEGKTPGLRLDWLVATHIQPLYLKLAVLLEMVQAQGSLPKMPAIFLHYIFNGAAQAIFALKPEYERLSGKKHMSQTDIDAYADALVALVLR